MHLIHSIVSWYIRKRLPEIKRFIENPISTQSNSLLYLIDKAKQTEFGRQHSFSQIKSIQDFQNAVPIQDYEDIKPSIERMLKRESGIIWPDEINWFAKSSGTTSDRSKYIPVSKETMEECHYKAARDVLALYLQNHPESKVFAGKGIVLGGSHRVSQLTKQVHSGDLSAVLMRNMNSLANFLSATDLSTALLDDWEEKIERIIESTEEQHITNLVGVPTWTLVLIKKILERKGVRNLLEVWPHLELYIHGGVSFDPYRTQFQELITSPQMNYVETYNASEGFFGIQDTGSGRDMLLMLDYGIYYEFVPMAELGNTNPVALSLGEVEIGKNYALVISTNSGLWRYMIGDTVQFTSLNPYRIIVSGRVKHFINVFGEEVIVDNSDKAIMQACHDTNSHMIEYTVAPIFMTGEHRGGHEWLIEFEQEPADLEKFTELLDQALQDCNSDYQAKRAKDIALKLPRVHSVPKGSFYKWLKNKGKLGGQHKVPRLHNTRQYVEEILESLGSD